MVFDTASEYSLFGDWARYSDGIKVNIKYNSFLMSCTKYQIRKTLKIGANQIMFTVANTFNTNDYYTDNNSVICTIVYNDYGTTGYDAWAEYNRRT